MKNRFQKGFTLIELLVVIAIIGILSSIVLASLSSARTKGDDAAIQGNLNNMRTQAELFYANSTTSNYGTVGTISPASLVGVCNPATGGIFAASGTGTVGAMITATKARSATVNCSVLPTTGSMTSWAVEAQLKSSSSYFCVDSSGAATTTAASTLTYNSDATCG